MKQNIIHHIRKSELLAIVLFCIGIQLTAQTDSIESRSQFLLPELSYGTIRLKTGKYIEKKINFNLLTGKMNYLENGKVMDLTNPEAVDTVFTTNKKFIYNDKIFLEVIVEAPVALYIEHKGQLISSGNVGPYGTTSQTSGPTSLKRYYTDSNTYNLKLPEEFKVIQSFVPWVKINNELHKFLTINQFQKLFPENKDKIKQFINKFKPSIKNPDDLVKLVNYCNELTR